MLVRTTAAVLATVLVASCSRGSRPYRADIGVYPRCRGLVANRSVPPWPPATYHEEPVCVVTFTFSRPNLQRSIRLWVSDGSDESGRAYVDVPIIDVWVPKTPDETVSRSEEIPAEFVNWFRRHCDEVIADVPAPDDSAACKSQVMDGNWMLVGQQRKGTWRWGETWRVRPDSALHELERASKALLSAVTAPTDLKGAHLVELGRIMHATTQYRPNGAELDVCTQDDLPCD
jgi:hypothetical protein